MLGRLLGEGREAQVYEWGDASVVRLLRATDTDGADRLRREADAMRAVAAAGGPVPQPDEVVTVDGRPGLVMERVAGRSLLDEAVRRPWDLHRVGRELADAHVRLHRVEAPASLPSLRTTISERFANGVPDSVVPDDLRQAAAVQLELLPDGDRLCHGNLWLGNVLRSRSGLMVIDWTDATRGDPTADFARTLVTTRRASLPPGAAVVARTFSSIGKVLVVRAFERAYRQAVAIDDDLLARWELVRTVERLAAAIEGEREPLLQLATARAERLARSAHP